MSRTIMNGRWGTFESDVQGKLNDKLIEGRTLVNLWSDNRDDFRVIPSHVQLIDNDVNITTISTEWAITRLLPTMMKADTLYTIVVETSGLRDGLSFRPTNMNPSDIFNHEWIIETNGHEVRVVRTRANIEENQDFRPLWQNVNQVVGIEASATISIYEGNLTNQTLNHTLPRQFSSPSNISVSSIGENLFDGEWESGTIVTATGQNATHATHHRTGNYIPVQGGRVVHIASNGGGAIRFFEYDFDRNLINTAATSWNFRTLSNTRFIRFITGAGSAINNSISVAYDNPIPATTPHNSTTQTLQYLKDGEWLPVPELQGIQVNGNLLVSDEITDTEYIQRVVEVDLEGIGGGLNASGGGFQNMWLNTAPIVGARPGGTNHVTSNKMHTNISSSNNMDNEINHTSWVGINPSQGNLWVTLPIMTPNSLATYRQYLIDNDYKFLVPLAEPRRYPIRSWDLPSHEPVTHVHVDSGAVSPRFSFKKLPIINRNGVVIQEAGINRASERLSLPNMRQYFDVRGSLELELTPLSGDNVHASGEVNNHPMDFEFWMTDIGISVGRNLHRLNSIRFLVGNTTTHDFNWSNGDLIKYRIEWDREANFTKLYVNGELLATRPVFDMPANETMHIGSRRTNHGFGNACYHELVIRNRFGRETFNMATGLREPVGGE